jgi:hypothetical protein
MADREMVRSRDWHNAARLGRLELCVSGTAIGFLILLMLAVTVAWIVFRGGERLLNWPIKILFGILAVLAIALIAGL